MRSSVHPQRYAFRQGWCYSSGLQARLRFARQHADANVACHLLRSRNLLAGATPGALSAGICSGAELKGQRFGCHGVMVGWGQKP